LTTYGDLLEGAAEHGDQHIDEDNGHDAEICSVHQFANKLRELVFLTQLKVIDVHETIDGKVERLNDFEEAERGMVPSGTLELGGIT